MNKKEPMEVEMLKWLNYLVETDPRALEGIIGESQRADVLKVAQAIRHILEAVKKLDKAVALPAMIDLIDIAVEHELRAVVDQGRKIQTLLEALPDGKETR